MFDWGSISYACLPASAIYIFILSKECLCKIMALLKVGLFLVGDWLIIGGFGLVFEGFGAGKEGGLCVCVCE